MLATSRPVLPQMTLDGVPDLEHLVVDGEDHITRHQRHGSDLGGEPGMTSRTSNIVDPSMTVPSRPWTSWSETTCRAF